MAANLIYLIPMLAFVCRIINGNEDCIDLLGRDKCMFLMKHRACSLSRKRMLHFCPKTCGECDWQKSCKNILPASRCFTLRRKGACKRDISFMQQMCAMTCKLCEESYKCRNIACGTGRYCTLDRYKKPYCSCLVPCNIQPRWKRLGPVCASDRVTYMNICVMKQVACKSRTKIYVTKYGNCPKYYSCRDSKWESRYGFCRRWQRAGLCKRYKKYLGKKCTKTCGYCQQNPDPFPCGNGDSYCCWDGTKADGPNGLGCRACKDKSGIFCFRFLPECGSKKESSRRVMRAMCPASCRYCNAKKSI